MGVRGWPAQGRTMQLLLDVCCRHVPGDPCGNVFMVEHFAQRLLTLTLQQGPILRHPEPAANVSQHPALLQGCQSSANKRPCCKSPCRAC